MRTINGLGAFSSKSSELIFFSQASELIFYRDLRRVSIWFYNKDNPQKKKKILWWITKFAICPFSISIIYYIMVGQKNTIFMDVGVLISIWFYDNVSQNNFFIVNCFNWYLNNLLKFICFFFCGHTFINYDIMIYIHFKYVIVWVGLEPVGISHTCLSFLYLS